MGGRGPGAVDKLDLAKARVGSGRGVACRNLLSHAQAISEVNGGIEQLGATKVGVAEIRIACVIPVLHQRLVTPSYLPLPAPPLSPLFHPSFPLSPPPTSPPPSLPPLPPPRPICTAPASPRPTSAPLHGVGTPQRGHTVHPGPRSVLSVALKPFRLTNRVTPFPSCFPVSLLLPLALPVAPLCAVRRSAQVSPAALVPAFCSSSGPLRLDAASTTGSAGRPVAGPVELQGERRFNSSGSGVVLHWAACVTFILVDLDDPIHPLHKPAVPISGAPPLPSITLPSAPTIPATQHHHSHCTLRHHPSLSPTITYVMTICCHSILPSMPF
ncbi:unnamed protein product [Closterium sp. NIES-65]|nr:unnamed protein product [Closterium sp. NIES-65]